MRFIHWSQFREYQKAHIYDDSAYKTYTMLCDSLNATQDDKALNPKGR